ncbi:peptidoglycan editing factor PgeF [Pseudoduganella sp. UC29_106]|uniref:peptidoglycan editing factor PgeF n=1 Tax=Pseudoduganella sp. UC29_106 TaxID=3374553 RepID=UPI003756D277
MAGPDWPDAPPNIGFLCTTRLGGVSPGPYGDGQAGGGLNLGLHVEDSAENVARNRALLRAQLPAEPVWLSQVHGTVVVDAATAADAGAGVPVADASIGRSPGVVCAVQTADCLPVLFADVDGRVVGAAHAGWRGLAAGVLEDTVEAMRTAGAGQISAWLGPAIGPQKFEVGQEVKDAFVARSADAAIAFRRAPGSAEGKHLADIYALARQSLARAGVARISGGDRCTVTEADVFYSYRRDRVTGRQATLIWIKN